ncbi:MAG: hypothetical protein KDJ27_15220 [Gammaproteobacteria bacterium]|nr:hypothetical protein [Gammaproteobacteria bacterium]
MRIIGLIFAALAVVFGLLWAGAVSGLRPTNLPARRTHLRIALIFGAVATWLLLQA